VCSWSVDAGVVLVWFRWHYDKKLLRNIDDEEFLEFSAKCPQRQAILVCKYNFARIPFVLSKASSLFT
jgi:hypothetical protein